ncbi:hypothetical protein HUA74_05790 [Myxococcus sp. CA051A]|uniref:Uncharacterized protein n=1 Tax=Myxococcus llanfairpwllgwyngyllgogerychwyrndrobwllllantysiliogogogochensis TaxID=2590453 RepID=A0A540X4S2_9BACT|nr:MULTISPECIES: hypothetical protein [Myxococcus]NTX07444.1 hypothetical protein [Myxococcus sp. CA040A]NTX10893.1 hypothetical protein [Myxococcus sp. CA056]NTX37221.1 hypothetical protein [Myxococcus sp. CA033]NTX53110.1 hypothetical protein [Myxococcus sp. CA039A]NTX60165.1 hypothetical protein [Myxococcus sp. CA051A]
MGTPPISGSTPKKVYLPPPEEKPTPKPVVDKKAQVNAPKDEFETADAAAKSKPVELLAGSPPAGGTNPVVPTNGTTSAKYQVGPATRPPIHHDNGFLQNPADPKDTKPIATKDPSFSDYAAKAKWELKLEAAKTFRPDLRDGTAAYDHFLHGNGKDRTFNYERFVTQDESGKQVLKSATQDTQKAAEAQYAAMVAKDPSLAGKPVTFQLTGGPIGVGGNDGKFPYPQSENWQKAIGGHSIWNSATVTVTPPAKPGDKPSFSMDMTVHAEDRYNFNPNQKDIATGIPDSDNGRFEQTGLAHQYTQTGTVQRKVTWGQGDIENATSTPIETGR